MKSITIALGHIKKSCFSFPGKMRIFKDDHRGAVNAGELIGVVIAIAISVIMISSMFPPSLDTFYDANTSDWTIDGEEDTKTTTIWEMLPMMGAVCALLLFVGIIVKMLK